MPNINKLKKICPMTEIYTSGLAVGLPEGQMGNSEVGHTNIGAGRVVYQELTRITKTIEDGDFFSIPEFTEAIENCKKNHQNNVRKSIDKSSFISYTLNNGRR